MSNYLSSSHIIFPIHSSPFCTYIKYFKRSGIDNYKCWDLGSPDHSYFFYTLIEAWHLRNPNPRPGLCTKIYCSAQNQSAFIDFFIPNGPNQFSAPALTEFTSCRFGAFVNHFAVLVLQSHRNAAPAWKLLWRWAHASWSWSSLFINGLLQR